MRETACPTANRTSGSASSTRVRWITADTDAVVGRVGQDVAGRLSCADVLLAEDFRPGALRRAHALLNRYPGCALAVIVRRRGRLTVLTRDGLRLHAARVDSQTPNRLDTVARALHEWWATRPPAVLLRGLTCAPAEHHDHRCRHARLRIRCAPLASSHSNRPARHRHRKESS
ncbi:hypothetical protein [Kutzneria sp. NPDC052558]|uniref:hypothetical protein n=1 Tax=Kutzneria sp. NPDC052558 TaxID=3364121 RepID=UPI0037C68D0B